MKERNRQTEKERQTEGETETQTTWSLRIFLRLYNINSFLSRKLLRYLLRPPTGSVRSRIHAALRMRRIHDPEHSRRH